MVSQFVTHDVFNQAPPLQGYDVFGADRVLTEGVDREGAPWSRPELGELGRLRAELNIIKDYGNMGEKGQANQSTGNIRASVQ